MADIRALRPGDDREDVVHLPCVEQLCVGEPEDLDDGDATFWAGGGKDQDAAYLVL